MQPPRDRVGCSTTSEPTRRRSRCAPVAQAAAVGAHDVRRIAAGSHGRLRGGERRGPLGDILSSWVIAPLIFLFLLSDTGRIKRGLLAAVPNRLFEPALAVLDDVDRALGNYVRGIFLECCALGVTVIVFTHHRRRPVRWAIAIGIFTGASNVIPYMGFAAAMLGGLAYALLAEDIHPLIPLVTPETFAIWVVAAVVLAELLKNVLYEPIILGGYGPAPSARRSLSAS